MYNNSIVSKKKGWCYGEYIYSSMWGTRPRANNKEFLVETVKKDEAGDNQKDKFGVYISNALWIVLFNITKVTCSS